MKRIGAYILHYGKEYLKWSIQSLAPLVDEIHVLYASKPTFGEKTTLPCPDSEEELYAEARKGYDGPLHWTQGWWPSVEAHRTYIREIAQRADADTVIWSDADELWPEHTLRSLVNEVERLRVHVGRTSMVNFWREFGFMVHEPATPVRVLHRAWSGDVGMAPPQPYMMHFGFVLTDAEMRYKLATTHHKSEIVPNWFENVWKGWTPESKLTNVHPWHRGTEPRVPVKTPAVYWEELLRLLNGHRFCGKTAEEIAALSG